MILKTMPGSSLLWSQDLHKMQLNQTNDHIYRMVKERYSNIWPNQTIVSDQSELTILLCQPMNSLLLMKTTLPWYSSLQLLPAYIDDPWVLIARLSLIDKTDEESGVEEFSVRNSVDRIHYFRFLKHDQHCRYLL